uniref:Copper transporter n=1 Tax=Romanomermis culicivorax TaxID=13658 RepID=A0A915JVK6_ROMCU
MAATLGDSHKNFPMEAVCCRSAVTMLKTPFELVPQGDTDNSSPVIRPQQFVTHNSPPNLALVPVGDGFPAILVEIQQFLAYVVHLLGVLSTIYNTGGLYIIYGILLIGKIGSEFGNNRFNARRR